MNGFDRAIGKPAPNAEPRPRDVQTLRAAFGPRVALIGLGMTLLVSAGCPPQPPTGNDNAAPNENAANQNASGNDNVSNGNDNTNGGTGTVWTTNFDASGVGFVSAVWGSAPDDVFAVGGQTNVGEIFHYDGTDWTPMNVPAVPRLIWVYGFAPDNVYAVGEGGGALHYDGARWNLLTVANEDEDLDTITDDLWGVWGPTPRDIWMVGGDTDDNGAPPVIVHFDGCEFTPVDLPEFDRAITAFFKVWGIGSKAFAVGSDGVIIELDPVTRTWSQVSAGAEADDDFVALWGTSEDNIVAVGGRSNGQIAHYDGTAWTTMKPSGVPALNAVFMTDPDEAIIGGINGYGAIYDVANATVAPEVTGATSTIHAAWGDGTGLFHVVGGIASGIPGASIGLALVRTTGSTTGFNLTLQPMPAEPDPAPAKIVLLEDNQFLADGITPAPDLILSDDDEIRVFAGSQGGFHIEPKSHITGFVEGLTVFELISFTYNIVDADSGETLGGAEGLPTILLPCAEAGSYRQEELLFPFSGFTTEELVGRTAEFTVSFIADADGETFTVETSMTFVLIDGGDDF